MVRSIDIVLLYILFKEYVGEARLVSIAQLYNVHTIQGADRRG